METKKVLSALCYFSVMFAGIIFPIIIYFVSEDYKVKEHAKKALLSHLIPIIAVPFVIIAAILDATGNSGGMFPFFFIVGIIISVCLSIGVLIWNIVKGVKVLQKDFN